MNVRAARIRTSRRLKLVLGAVLLFGVVGSFTVGGVYGLLSGQLENHGSSLSSGTFTLNNTNAGDSASTTLTQNVGTTTLASATPQTTLASNVGSTTLAADVGTTTLTSPVGVTTLAQKMATTTTVKDAAGITAAATQVTPNSTTGWPTVYPFYIQIDSERMKVTALAGGKWTIARGADGTTAAPHSFGATITQVSITVASATTFPGTFPYDILVDSEQMTVTSVPDGTAPAIWIVTRAVNGTTLALHGTTGRPVNQVTINVASAARFPPSGTYTIQVDSEQMTVTGGQGTTTWTVTRAANGTTAAAHSNGATVNANTISVASAANFPGAGTYTIQIDSEQMTVTAGQGSTTWTVTRAVNGTTAASHASGTGVHPTTITVSSSSGFPATPFTVQVDSEQMTVTAESGTGNTTWTITRSVNGTTGSAHSAGAGVNAAWVTVSSAASFPASGSYTIRVDDEQMTVTGGQGTTTWTVTRGANGTTVGAHSGGATVLQTTMTVASATGFPTSSVYTVLVDSERMMVVSGMGTTTWTVVRAADGTSAAGHSSGSAVATSPCRSLDGTSNVNNGCDSIFTFSRAAENYPGTPVVSRVTIANTGSIGASDLVVYMPGCLRGITPDAPLASTVPGTPTFSGASTTGGHLAALVTYYYEITAVTASGESIAGGEASYMPPLGTSTNQITLNWTAVSGATSYKVYRSDSTATGGGEGGEQLLASGIGGTSYTDNSATAPSGSPPSGTGSGNPCVTGTAQLYIQETNASGVATYCWYPTQNSGACAFDGTWDLGLFAQYLNTLGTGMDLGSGPAAVGSRYFKIGVQLPNASPNSLQGTSANFTLAWQAQS